MINEETIKNYFAFGFIAIILFLSYLILQPLFLSIVLGLILAYTFSPIDKWILKIVKNKFISSLITCGIFLIFLFTALWFLVPLLASQVFQIFLTIQTIDVIGLLQRFLPFLFTSEDLVKNFTIAYNNFISNLLNYSLNMFTDFLVNFSWIVLRSLIVMIVFFYALKDGDKIVKLMRELVPFEKDLTNRFINKSKEVTFSVIFGRVVIGIIMGILTGIGFFLAGVENTLLLTFVAIIAAIIPIIGPWLVWVPVVIGLFIAGKTTTALLLLIYCGTFISFFDNFLHAQFIAKKSSIPTSATLIGLIGGIFAFGIFGIILGPLIIAYLITLIEIYREHNKKIIKESS